MEFNDEFDELDINNIFDTDAPLGDDDKDDSNKDKDIETNEIDENNLFPSSESVVSEDKDKQDKEDTTETKVKEKSSASPNTYSSLTKALKDDGVLPDLDDEFLEKVVDADTFAEAIEKQVELKLEENQKRIKQALDNGVESSEIKYFENTISYLDTITEDFLQEETEQASKLREQLIFQDYINKGFSEERAQKQVKKSVDSGSDVDDAIDALESNKEHFNSKYEDTIKTAKKEVEDNKKAIKKEAAELEKKVLETESPFTNVTLDKNTRKQVFENINKPVFKDEDGNFYTAIQKYQKENKTDFLHKIGVIFTLTDGFKNMDKLIKGAVKSESRRSLKEFEHTLVNSRSLNDGNLEFVGGITTDKESHSGRILDV